MENNNYNDNNGYEGFYDNADQNHENIAAEETVYHENSRETAADAQNAENTAADGAQQETSGSAYGYSYIHQDQKNPNNIWRAEENTAGAGDSYGSGQAGADSGYESSQQYSGAQAEASAGGSGPQTESGSAYSDIYGNTAGQGRWHTYSEAKKQKKAQRAQKYAGHGGSSNFGIKLAKCASIALVFGLVAGTAFEGSSYLAGNLLGTNEEKSVEVSEENKKDKDVLNSDSSTVKTTDPVSASLVSNSGVVPIVESCMPSIVAITNLSEVQVQNFFGQVQQYEVPSAGSGIIVSEDDTYLYIATNNHVVSSASTLTVQFVDDSTAGAEVKGTDPSTDLAVIQVKKADIDAEAMNKIKIAELGDSDSIQVGSQAIAIGNALGYGQSVTMGIVSALGREVSIQDETSGETYTNDLIQTDAAINPGNSGGALLDMEGRVIGINSSKYSDTKVEGMGFAIPSNLAKQIIEDLIEKEAVSEDKAGFLGVYPENVSSSVSEAYNMPEGVFVKEITKGSAAEKYGLKAGDIITKLDDRDIKTKNALYKRLSYYAAGDEVAVTIQRQAADGGYEEMTIDVVLGSRNS